mmetsp:Transcript_16612/g.40859  ORF Transcript_16612/g.40859 Transcript_16612/m.40859 type:complete len:648 (-) Transcript_16612:1604-3547(-)
MECMTSLAGAPCFGPKRVMWRRTAASKSKTPAPASTGAGANSTTAGACFAPKARRTPGAHGKAETALKGGPRVLTPWPGASPQEAASGRGGRVPRAATHEGSQTSHSANSSVSIVRSVSSVGVVTLACKVLGLVREVATAASFGVGWIVDSHSHATMIPSFFFVALGGLNGPVHSAVGAALSCQSDRATSRRPADCLVTVTSIVACALSVATCVTSTTIVRLASPGLDISLCGTVASQLRIMSPCILLAAVNGVQMARLTTSRRLVVPVLSPAISSLTVIALIAYHSFTPSLAAHGMLPMRIKPEHVLACGTTLGAAIQCFVLGAFTTEHYKSGSFQLRSLASLGSTRVQQSMKMLVHACMTSGVLQIAASTDLFFASFSLNAAAGLGYANLLATTPLAILSTSLMVPLVPLFAKHREPVEWHALRKLVSKVLLVTFAMAVLVAAILAPLAHPIVSLVFERQAFDANAREVVSAMFSVYITGGFTYIARDLVVRVFYAIGDGFSPLRTSILTVVVNAALNWLFAWKFALGSQGIALSTVVTNGVSTLVLMHALTRKIGGLDTQGVVKHLFTISVAGMLSFAATTGTHGYLTSSQLFTAGFLAANPWARGALFLCLSALSGVAAFLSAVLIGFTGDPLLRDFVDAATR